MMSVAELYLKRREVIVLAQIDLQTGLQLQVKRVPESVKYTFDFSGLLAKDDNILSVGTPTQLNRGNVVASTDLVIGLTAHNALQEATVVLSGGTHDEFYTICLPVTSSSGDIRVVSGVIYVYDVC